MRCAAVLFPFLLLTLFFCSFFCAAPNAIFSTGLNSIIFTDKVVKDLFSFDLNRFGMAEDDEAMSGYHQKGSLEAKLSGATVGLAKTAKRAERASRIASARAEKAEKDAQRAAAAVLGAGDSEE